MTRRWCAGIGRRTSRSVTIDGQSVPTPTGAAIYEIEGCLTTGEIAHLQPVSPDSQLDNHTVRGRSTPLRYGTTAGGEVRENAQQASGSGVGLLQAGWDVSAGVKESPDIDRGFALQVEQQVRELADRHDPQVRNREFVREAQRSNPRVSADAFRNRLDCVHEADGCCDVGFGDVVATG